jgi:hypothetical protein
MIRSGNAIRLTQKDKARLTTLTGTSPDSISTVDGLNNFVDFHLGMHAGETPEAKLLTMLLEDEKIQP